MIKDIQWLKEEIGELPCVDTVFISDGLSYMDSAVPVLAVYDLINQLDEPEVSQLDKKIRELESYNNELIRDNNQLRHAIDNQEVLSQELPVIPQFVADWIEEVKPDNSLRVAFEYIAQQKRDNYDDELAFWVEEGNSELFARAWLYGFTVEEEQKYYIRDQHGVYLLAKNHREQGNVQTVAEIVEYYGVEEIELDYELTEEEIKGYDPRYMTFAKPIEELE